jgi:hypothetical protein
MLSDEPEPWPRSVGEVRGEPCGAGLVRAMAWACSMARACVRARRTPSVGTESERAFGGVAPSAPGDRTRCALGCSKVTCGNLASVGAVSVCVVRSRGG